MHNQLPGEFMNQITKQHRIGLVIAITIAAVALLSLKPNPTMYAQNEKGVTISNNVATLKAGFIFKRISKNKVEVGKMVQEPSKDPRTPRRAFYQRSSALNCTCLDEIIRECEVKTSGSTSSCGKPPANCKECSMGSQ